MSRHGTPKQRADRQRFPIRIRIKTPELGFGKQLHEIHEWLRINAGQDGHAMHSTSLPGLDASTVYFLDVGIAAEFMDAFDVELAEWVLP